MLSNGDGKNLVGSPHITVLVFLMLALNYLNLASGGLSKLGKHENTELSQSWRKIQKILIYHNFSAKYNT